MGNRIMEGPVGYPRLGRHEGPHVYSAACDVDPACSELKDEPEGPVNPESPRASALNEARDLITGDRNNQYGPPTQDFDRTAKLLNAMGYARIDAEGVVQDILPSDVALIIAQVKVSRLMHSRRKRDSWVDLAGYAACGFECAEEEGKPGAS